MSKKKKPFSLYQKGIVRLLLLFTILFVIPLTVFIAKKQQEIRQRASEISAVAFVDSNGKGVTKTDSPTVRLKLLPPVWEKQLSDPISRLLSQNDTNQNTIRVSGWISGVSEAVVIDTCTNTLVNHAPYAGDNLTHFSFQLPRGTKFCVRTTDLSGYTRYAVNWPVNPLPTSYENQVAGVNCLETPESCDSNEQHNDLPSDANFGFFHIRYKGTTPTPSVLKPSPCNGVGDVTIDGVVSEADSKAILQIIAGSKPFKNPTPEERRRADINGDKTVTSTDAFLLKRYLDGLDETLKACTVLTPTATAIQSPTVLPTSALSSPTPIPVTTAAVVLSEDSNFSINNKTVVFSSDSVTYTFSDAAPGVKTLYVKFIASDGREQSASPFPATITLLGGPTQTLSQ